jgi:hypothetical protein
MAKQPNLFLVKFKYFNFFKVNSPLGKLVKLLPDKFNRSRFVNLEMLSGKTVNPLLLKLSEVTCEGFFQGFGKTGGIGGFNQKIEKQQQREE